jgi:hypothetical protein
MLEQTIRDLPGKKKSLLQTLIRWLKIEFNDQK